MPKILSCFFSIILIYECLAQQSSDYLEVVVESEKNETVQGESILFQFSLIIDPNGPWAPYNFEKHFDDIEHELLKFGSFFIEQRKISNPNSQIEIEGKKYIKHIFDNVAICPDSVGKVRVNEIEFKFWNKNDSSLLTRFSNPLELNVIPQNLSDLEKIKDRTGILLVGDFLLESEYSNSSYSVGDSIGFSTTIEGYGNSFPFEIEEMLTDSILIIQGPTSFKYDIMNRDIWTTKRIDFTIVPLKSGILNLSEYINWSYWSLDEKKTKEIVLDEKLEIHPSDFELAKGIKNPIGAFVVIDVSKSMNAFGYEATRIIKASEVVNGINKRINSPVFAYAGNVFPYDNLKNRHKMEAGSSIGEAIWHGIKYFQGKSFNKKIILIGDGDETSGAIRSIQAARIAAKNGIKIYSVGVGHKGKVLFPKNGKLGWIVDSFRDDLFKEVSRITGGKYYHINSDAFNIDVMLDEIFNSD